MQGCNIATACSSEENNNDMYLYFKKENNMISPSVIKVQLQNVNRQMHISNLIDTTTYIVGILYMYMHLKIQQV